MQVTMEVTEEGVIISRLLSWEDISMLLKTLNEAGVLLTQTGVIGVHVPSLNPDHVNIVKARK